AKAAGRSRRRSTRACLPMSCPPPSTSGSARAARRISPTSCSRPCATNSAGISRSLKHEPASDRSADAGTEPSDMTSEELDQRAINTIRTLSSAGVQQAESGHPGTPMALAPLVDAIWNRVMRFDPQDPIWPNRDRFVLSNGHASMLLWSLLYLTRPQAVNAEYERRGKPSVTLADIRRFRQLESKAPGHPGCHWGCGADATRGPLRQGVGACGRTRSA